MVEAIVALPAFVIVFVSIILVRDQYVAQQSANARARTCAWLYSESGCSRVPPGCEEPEPAERASNPLSEAFSDATTALADGTRDAAVDLDLSGFQDTAASALGALLEPFFARLFENDIDATGRAHFRKPRLYGGGEHWAIGHARIACNLESRTSTDTLSQVFDDIFP